MLESILCIYNYNFLFIIQSWIRKIIFIHTHQVKQASTNININSKIYQNNYKIYGIALLGSSSLGNPGVNS